jgi:hypothetical protein
MALSVHDKLTALVPFATSIRSVGDKSGLSDSVTSNAPTSQPTPCGRKMPRWSSPVVQSTAAIAYHFGQHLKKRGRGGIILVSAMGAPQGIPYMANDAATKAYIVSLGQSLNVEFQKYGVNVSVLMPGPTLTPVFEEFGFEADKMPMKPMSVEQCVQEGLEALIANRPSHLTGRINRLLTTLIPASITRKFLGAMIAEGIANKASAET